jgi:predicted alpha/beta-hydrolase family hydrolase
VKDAPATKPVSKTKRKAAPDSKVESISERVVTLDVSGRPISVGVHGEGPCAVVLGPGAGGTRQAAQLVAVATALDPARYTTLLFNFPYQEARRSFPDPAPLLEATVKTVADYARETLGASGVVVGGRSMGGRMASQAAAKGLACDGLVFLAYPLHPPGDEAKMRDAHLASIRSPMLFLQGTRDEFARLDLLTAVVARLGENAQLVLFEDADHSFKTRRGAALNSKQTEAALLTRLVEWLDGICGSRAGG